MLSLMFQNPIVFVLVAAALIISISIHEFSHAFVAYKLGDPTAKYMGRVTLNPKAHLDLYGSLFLIFAGFGWGKPVMFNPINLKNPKRDSALIALAGPLSNFLLALVLSFFFKILGMNSILGIFLYFVILYNLFLGLFNLLPVFPLDGFNVVKGFLPYDLSYQWKQLEKYGLFILILLLITNLPSRLISPLVETIMKLLLR